MQITFNFEVIGKFTNAGHNLIEALHIKGQVKKANDLKIKQVRLFLNENKALDLRFQICHDIA